MNLKEIIRFGILSVIFALATAVVDQQQIIRDVEALKTKADAAAFSSAELQESLENLKKAVGEVEPPAQTDDEEKVKKRNERLEKFGKVVSGASSSITKFSTGNTEQIISGVLDLTSMALTTFGGPVGAAVGTVLSLVSNLFMVFMKSPKTQPSVGTVIKEALNDFRDTELFERMQAFTSTFKGIHEGLSAVIKEAKSTKGKNLQSYDVILLNEQIKSFESSLLLDEVKHAIEADLKSGEHDKPKKALKSLNMYCKLTAVVELVIWEFIACVEGEGMHKSFLPLFYKKVMENRRKNDKDYFEFLHQPTPEYGLAAALYQHKPSEYEALRKYISEIGVAETPDNPLIKTDTEIYLRPKKWSGYYAYTTSDPATKYWMYGYESSSLTDQGKFTLKPVYYPSSETEDNVFTLRNKYYTSKDLMAYKYNGCQPLKYPDTVDYILVAGKSEASDNYVTLGIRNCYKTKTSDAYDSLNDRISRNYLWKFTKIKVGNGNCPYYLISAVNYGFGADYVLEMTESGSKPLRLKRGYPGESAIWKIGSCS